MNILFLLRLYPIYGGGETVTICLANEMVKRGWNVNILYFKDNIREQLPFIDPRIRATKIEGINYGEFSTQDASKLTNETNIVNEFTIKFIHDNKINVVINQWWPLCFIDCIKAKAKVKVIKVHHTAVYTPPLLEGKDIKTRLKRTFHSLYEKYKQKQAVKTITATLPYIDRYVFLSPTFQQQYVKISHTKHIEKLAAIPNPLVFNQYITQEEYEKKEHIALIVGRMCEPPKRITRALRAWSIVEKNPLSADWKLLIVGEGPDLPMYKQLAKELNLNRISFEGYQQPLPYYEKAKIFLMTSAVEGFAMTLIESQQQGVVPIVMDTFLSLHEIITSGENGIIISNNDEVAFANAILNLITEPDKLDKLARNALISCKRFSIETIVDEWEQLIESI